MGKSISASKFLGVLLTVLAIAILVKLGFWQLDRAAQKETFFADYAARGEQTVALNQLSNPSNTVPRFAQVTLAGQFIDDYLLLDNQIREGQVGYHVIGLLQANLAAGQRIVMINLGWVPLGENRDSRPQLSLPAQPLTLNGYFYLPEITKVWGVNAQVIEMNQRPVRIQQLDNQLLSDALQLPIEPYVVLLSENNEFGWPREWQPQVMTPAKHRAYAWQWFSLALACLLVFWFASRSRRKTTEE